ncbi:hypothetical protein HK101_007357 [Irineochytrium annulatum]|nr:hypothetical protein HK101_007357 [Irineochytrium annulatum]
MLTRRDLSSTDARAFTTLLRRVPAPAPSPASTDPSSHAPVDPAVALRLERAILKTPHDRLGLARIHLESLPDVDALLRTYAPPPLPPPLAIRCLDLSHCGLTALPDLMPTWCAGVRHLSLRGNALTALPVGVLGLTLDRLDLGGNPFQGVGGAVVNAGVWRRWFCGRDGATVLEGKARVRSLVEIGMEVLVKGGCRVGGAEDVDQDMDAMALNKEGGDAEDEESDGPVLPAALWRRLGSAVNCLCCGRVVTFDPEDPTQAPARSPEDLLPPDSGGSRRKELLEQARGRAIEVVEDLIVDGGRFILPACPGYLERVASEGVVSIRNVLCSPACAALHLGPTGGCHCGICVACRRYDGMREDVFDGANFFQRYVMPPHLFWARGVA